MRGPHAGLSPAVSPALGPSSLRAVLSSAAAERTPIRSDPIQRSPGIGRTPARARLQPTGANHSIAVLPVPAIRGQPRAAERLDAHTNHTEQRCSPTATAPPR